MKITGFCPTLQKKHEVYANFGVQSRYFVEEPQYLLSGFECDYARQCHISGECPICKSVISQLQKS